MKLLDGLKDPQQPLQNNIIDAKYLMPPKNPKGNEVPKKVVQTLRARAFMTSSDRSDNVSMCNQEVSSYESDLLSMTPSG